MGTTKHPDIDFLTTISISLFSWFSFFFIYILGIIYRTVVDVVLKLTLKKNSYAGLLSRADNVFFTPCTVSKFYITCVLYIRSSKPINVMEKFKLALQEKVFDKPEDYPKLTNIRKCFAGCSYWEKNQCNIDDVLFPLDLDILNEETLKVITAKISNSDHPKNNCFLWDIYVSEKPMDDDKNDGFYRYPVITRFHHGVADGTSLAALLIKLFAESKTENYSQSIFKKPSSKSKRITPIEAIILQAIKLLNFINLMFEMIFISIGKSVKFNFLRISDNNALHGSNYSGDKIIAWSCEDRIECLPMIKKIKNSTKSRFVSVINTAVAVSMTNYFKRNNLVVPQLIGGGMAALLDFPELDPNKPVQLENKATFGLYEVPTHTRKRQTETLSIVNKNISEQMKYSDLLIGRTILAQILGSLPLKFVNTVMGFDGLTYMLTNVPGGSQITISDDCVIEKVVPLAPNIKGYGVSIAFTTFDERLNVGLLIDKKLVSSQKEVQKIADDVFDSIRTLNAEISTRVLNL